MAVEPSVKLELGSDFSRVQVPAGNPDDAAGSEEATYPAWYDLLKVYTKRQLTFDGDRLPAIGAFAKRFHAHLGDQYCAGLWRGDLLHGLLWGAAEGSEGCGPPGSPFLRARLRFFGYYEHQDNTARSDSSDPGLVGVTSEHRAPSWSWAGAKSGVELSWPRELYNYTSLAKVVDIEVRSKPGDDFGCVEGGELVLDAPYRHLRLWLSSYASSLSSPASLVLRALTRLGPLPRTRKLAQLVLTRPGSLASTPSARSVAVPSSSTRFTLIQIAKTESVVYLLLLQPLPADDGHNARRQHYRTVGLLRLQPWEYDDDKYVGEEMTDRLEGAAYREVTRAVAQRQVCGGLMVVFNVASGVYSQALNGNGRESIEWGGD